MSHHNATSPTQSHARADDPVTNRSPDSAYNHDALLLNIEGYEGPLDVLLDLARSQKVDLTKISILQLVQQYLRFINRAKDLNLELAAEYLVMAAWLTYLKSRLLLPQEQTPQEHSAEDMAEALQFQLRRLESIQNAADQLSQQPHLGDSRFARGMPEGLSIKTRTIWDADLMAMLRAYGNIKQRSHSEKGYDLPTFQLLSAERAMENLQRMLGELPKGDHGTVWATLDSLLPQKNSNALFRKSTLASTLTAMLELAKQGQLEVKQDGLFRPIYMRGRTQHPDQGHAA